jgi:hypothetical protein
MSAASKAPSKACQQLVNTRIQSPFHAWLVEELMELLQQQKKVVPPVYSVQRCSARQVCMSVGERESERDVRQAGLTASNNMIFARSVHPLTIHTHTHTPHTHTLLECATARVCNFFGDCACMSVCVFV